MTIISMSTVYQKEVHVKFTAYFFGFVPIGHFWQVSPFSPKNILGSQSTVREKIIESSLIYNKP